MDKEYNGEPWNLLQILANINILVGEEPSEDVIEREKIDKAIEAITKLRDSTSRMITEEPNLVNECYEQYVNCFDECLRIIKRNIGE
jgi:hypothetical protein